MLPAPAGMSLALIFSSTELVGAPRASGDEPATAAWEGIKNACSPRQRG
ncbi:hypothetical protein HMPREF0297_0696 [Corynebacterium jeikeium ATCC 43734]|nr:hypothetical protein HMPREF0297_0696 [Corynebacterium jeikeium ATCC 43734]